MPKKIKLEYRLIDDTAKVPTRNLATDAAFDIYSIEEFIMQVGRTARYRTGIQISAPPGYYWTIESRSGLMKKGIFAGRAIIDATYTGEVIVCLHNMGWEDYKVRVGDRIAQLILHEVVEPYFEEVEEFSSEYNQRGEAGWGSSGS